MTVALLTAAGASPRLSHGAAKEETENVQYQVFRTPGYSEAVDRVAALPFIPWRELESKTVLVTGASGLIGSHLIDVLLRRNRGDANIKVVAVGRNVERLKERFGDGVACVAWDMRNGESPTFGCRPDYIVHLASNTHPLVYATDPVGTVMMNVVATKTLLDCAAQSRARFVYASSVEIYGKNRGDVDLFSEDYCGYIDCNTLRAGYPESKRCGEALCQAYRGQCGVDFVIPRLARCYGPTLRSDDTKALSQFLGNALRGEDIVLKSEGLQHFSYLHVSDAVSGLLTVMLKGETGNAYNLADPASDITLRDLAALIAAEAGRKVVFDLPDATERAGFSTATTARLDSRKVRALGWSALYDIKSGIHETYTTLKTAIKEAE